MIVRATRWLSLVLLVALSGCHALMDHYDERSMAIRDRCAAERAWWGMRSVYSCVEHRGDFGRGFKDGYIGVCQGGTGCLPTLPPRRYWGVAYQSPVGQQQQMAWFDGYAHGAAAAQMDGAATWNQLMIPPNVRAAGQPMPAPAGPGPAVMPAAPAPAAAYPAESYLEAPFPYLPTSAGEHDEFEDDFEFPNSAAAPRRQPHDASRDVRLGFDDGRSGPVTLSSTAVSGGEAAPVSESRSWQPSKRDW